LKSQRSFKVNDLVGGPAVAPSLAMSRSAQAISTALHVLFILFLLIWSINPDAIPKPSEIVHIFSPKPLTAPSGGSGMRQPEPPRKGAVPLKTTRVFITPFIQNTEYQPKLMLPPAIDAPPEMNAQPIAIGLPDGLGNLSGGPGGPYGIGTGTGGAPGNGSGNHSGDGNSDGPYLAGRGGVSLPVPLRTVEPEYSEAGRKARLSGSVLVAADIDTEGHPRNVKIIRGMGLGLDEKALEAVAQWLFKPGMKDGKPVPVRATFEINFRLL
jgi:protein TonB